MWRISLLGNSKLHFFLKKIVICRAGFSEDCEVPCANHDNNGYEQSMSSTVYLSPKDCHGLKKSSTDDKIDRKDWQKQVLFTKSIAVIVGKQVLFTKKIVMIVERVFETEKILMIVRTSFWNE